VPLCFSPPIDELSCHPSFAISVATALEIRTCIKQKKALVPLSANYIYSCSKDINNLRSLWEFAEKTGVVSETCFPYACASVKECPSACSSSQTKFTKTTAGFGTFKEIKGGIDIIKNEILISGPVTTWMKTFEDFSVYKGGIYQCKNTGNEEFNQQAVILYGWGIENGTNFWLARNSWGTQWGENGYFRIAFNTPCIIEQNVAVSKAK